jgi:putative two-component system response regulator
MRREARFPDARILAVDDDPSDLLLLRRLLETRGARQVWTVSDPREAVETFAAVRPDVVLLDIHMPHLDGFEVMRRLREHTGPGEYVPILILTSDSSAAVMRRALGEGATDYLTKPLDGDEVLLRIGNLLEARFLHLDLRVRHENLEGEVFDRTRALEEAQVEILERLGRAAEFRDDATGSHARRVGDLSAMLARMLDLPEEEVELIWRAAPLHDVGKIAVPDVVLLKPGRLTESEWVILRTHAAVGSMILSGSHFPVLRLAEEIALSHHERWDGTGYPHRLRGEEIPLASRIVAVVDTFDALVRERPYKPAWTPVEAVREIVAQRGRQFDPRVVDAFVEIWRMEGGELPESDGRYPLPTRRDEPSDDSVSGDTGDSGDAGDPGDASRSGDAMASADRMASAEAGDATVDTSSLASLDAAPAEAEPPLATETAGDP